MSSKKHDIFLSYSRLDREKVKPLVRILEDQGWSVWWDPEIPHGKEFDRIIEENLEASRVVVVIWSKNSVDSSWVRAEAHEGLISNVLMPARIEEAKLPLAFKMIQTANLKDWEEGVSHDELDRFLKSIGNLLGEVASSEPKEEKLSNEQRNKNKFSAANTFVDPRDGQVYETIEINGLIWMAENLNFEVEEGGWFYDKDPKIGQLYGRLYTWKAAKKACPPGWRLPTEEEWRKLAEKFGGYYDYKGERNKKNPIRAYRALLGGGGSGFSAVLGGARHMVGDFEDLDIFGYYWSATEWEDEDEYEDEDGDIPSYSWAYFFNHRSKKLCRRWDHEFFAYSCRCVKD